MSFCPLITGSQYDRFICMQKKCYSV
uniref:Uncharacterized protein n=1 Tax=Anguilla anguilla TaxID=7936 RepID=A0A0E9R7N9_ANGAN